MDDPVASSDAAPVSNAAVEAGDDEEAGDEEVGDEEEEEEAAEEAEDAEEAEGEEAAEHESLPAAPAVVAAEADVATAPPAAPAAAAAPAVKISAAGLDATTAKILERAARFGTSIPSTVQAKLEEEKRAARAARFGLETKAPEAKEKKNKNQNKNNNNNTNNKKGAENPKGNAKGQQQRSTGSAAVDEAMLKRIARFGAVAPAAQQFEAASKLQKRKERFGNASADDSNPQAKKQKTEPRVIDPELQAKLDARAKRFAANQDA